MPNLKEEFRSPFPKEILKLFTPLYPATNQTMKSSIHLLLISLALSLTCTADDYAVVVSKATYMNKDWQPVVAALVKKHGAKVIEHEGSSKRPCRD